MLKLLAIFRKDLLVRFASPAEWLFFLILPVVFTLVLGGGANPGTADRRIRVLVVDEANNARAAEVLAALQASSTVRPEARPRVEAEREFDERRVAAVLFIPATYTDEAVRAGTATLTLRQQRNNLNALAAERAVLAVVARLGQAVSIATQSTLLAEAVKPFATLAEQAAYQAAAQTAAQAALAAAPQRLLVTRAVVADTVDYDPAANASAGQLVTWVVIPLLGISGLFAFERTQGTLRRAVITPTGRAVYLLGTLGGQVLMALMQMTVLVTFGALVMGLPWGRDPLALALVLVSFALAAAALGTTLGTFIKTEAQANGLSIMLGMVMALLGGCWYPAELFPEAVRTAVQVLPTTWAMNGLLDIVLRGQGVGEVLLESGVLLGMALIFFTVGVWRFKFE